jgi:hypothetical protein
LIAIDVGEDVAIVKATPLNNEVATQTNQETTKQLTATPVIMKEI